jgi:competence protein ComEC
MHRKTLLAVVGLSSGIASGYLSAFSSETAIASLLVIVLLAAVLHRERKSDTQGIAFSVLGIIFFFFVIIGILRVQSTSEPQPFVCEAPYRLDGVVDANPTSNDEYQMLIVHVDDEHSDVQVRIPLYPKYRAGETISFFGKASLPLKAYPHGGAAPFDYASYLRTRDIGSEMLYPKIEVVDEESHSFKYSLMRFKEMFVMKINAHISPPASELASGMLFGNASMGKGLKETFRIAGLSHVVVLSGFNIAIVISFALVIFKFLPLIARVLTSAGLVIIFVVMVGGEASVIRATLMAFVSLLATLTGREYVARQALLISFLLIIMYEPYALLHDVSLHLSFLATAGIVHWNEALHVLFQKRMPSFLAETASTTLAAYLATMPYIMHAFGTVSLYAILANIIVLPFVPLVMLSAFATVVASYLFPILASLCGIVTTVLGKGIVLVASGIAKLPLASVSADLSFSAMIVAYILIAATVAYFSKRKNETLETTSEGYLTEVISF